MRVSLSVLLTLAVGCVPFVRVTEPAPRSSREVEASFTNVWDAAIDVFSEQNIGIKTLDRASGLIVAETAAVDPYRDPRVNVWSECDGGLPPNRVAYNLVIRGDSTRATVKATALWQSKAYSDGTPRCISKGVWEESIEASIAAKALLKKSR